MHKEQMVSRSATLDLIAKKYYRDLVSYCTFLCQNEWDGEDIAQETILKAMKYNEAKITRALLKKIAYHQWIDVVRKKKKEQLTENHVDIETRNHHLTETIELLLEKLTVQQALAFSLKEAFLFKNSEIAEMLNMKEASVKSLLHRARKRLGTDMKELNQQWDEPVKRKIFQVFHRALEHQHPTELIKLLPVISHYSTSKQSTPSNAFNMMAA
ncbi:sigma-70 family RNA polymerase sigma factor [Cytobacillus kochii]|uniref:sigma-70 family RNA polymerase sigma factor n=1 Tax=Cytobacillus kochii TaxID=859143 RepID=UPI00203C8645|nr:sigma-70 family RNA polymerase sigma factor [Cytobacillus kochii]MCM3324479.1 sigma-70 family RNA polymerase sigma factor [Cytobacillus kochii]MCM3346872.1 sigma-70 family RNA polymerase sigma factor [Cytobacillus kochii]